MKWLFLWAVLLVSAPASAETIIVRSGEHEGFSRLVLPLAAASAWRFGKSPDGYTLELSRADMVLDLDDVYRLIPRKRLAGVEYDSQKLRLRLNVGCNCHATAFAPNTRAIAIDIKDGPAPEESPFEKPLAPDAPAPAAPAIGLAGNAQKILPVTGQQDGIIQNDAVLRFFWRNQASSMLETKPHAAEEPQGGPALAASPLPEISPGLTGVKNADIRNDLAEQFGRAATQGLVIPVQDHVLSATDVAAEAAPPSPVEAPPVSASSLSSAPQLRIRTDTAFDRDMGTTPAPNETHGGKACLPDDLLDLNSWGDAKDAAARIGAMNRALVGEFDAPDQLTVNALTHYYLMLGWGAEARAVMREFPSAAPDEPVLTDLSEILDDGSTNGSSLAGMESCPGNAALWSVLSHPTLQKSTDVNRTAVIGAFSRLPLHLRRHLLPEIAERFLGIGDRDTAQALRDTVARAGGDHGIPLKLAEAEIDLNAGNTAQAAMLLADIVAADNETSPEALVKLIDLHVGNGEKIDAETVSAVDALAYEHRGTELGGRLSRAHVQAAAANGALDEAFAAWHRLDSAKLTETDKQHIASAIGRGMLAEQEDATFLRLILAHGKMLAASDLPAETRANIAQRLLSLAFPVEAREFLLAGDDQPDDPTALHLLAESYLAQGDAAAAIGMLAGRRDDDSIRLHAEALSVLGDDRAAAKMIGGAGDKNAGAEYDWRAGNWAAVSAQGDGARSAVAALLLARGTLPPSAQENAATPLDGTAGPAETSATNAPPSALAKAAAMVEESRQARDTLRALLAQPVIAE